MRLGMLLIAAWLFGTGGAVAQAPQSSDLRPLQLSLFAHADTEPLDREGGLDRGALLERVQLIVWDRQSIAKPAAEGALGAASAELLFGIISGGSGAGQDLANPKE